MAGTVITRVADPTDNIALQKQLNTARAEYVTAHQAGKSTAEAGAEITRLEHVLECSMKHRAEMATAAHIEIEDGLAGIVQLCEQALAEQTYMPPATDFQGYLDQVHSGLKMLHIPHEMRTIIPIAESHRLVQEAEAMLASVQDTLQAAETMDETSAELAVNSVQPTAIKAREILGRAISNDEYRIHGARPHYSEQLQRAAEMLGEAESSLAECNVAEALDIVRTVREAEGLGAQQLRSACDLPKDSERVSTAIFTANRMLDTANSYLLHLQDPEHNPFTPPVVGECQPGKPKTVTPVILRAVGMLDEAITADSPNSVYLQTAINGLLAVQRRLQGGAVDLAEAELELYGIQELLLRLLDSGHKAAVDKAAAAVKAQIRDQEAAEIARRAVNAAADELAANPYMAAPRDTAEVI